MNFFSVHVDPKAIENVTKTLASTFISEGEQVEVFEQALESKLGLSNPVATNSGTSALVLALAVAGIGPGHEVIVPAQTFIATGLAVLQVGAKPIFADIDPKTGNIDPKSIEGKITEHTEAIVPVHWGGYPCDLGVINRIARKYGLLVIEDAAHALGATYCEHPIGTISDFTCFSFQAIKHLTTGDGGCLCCKRKEDARKAKALRWFGVDRENSKPGILGERIFDITELGYKFHMNDVAASIGLGNLEGFEQRLSLRQKYGCYYRKALEGVSGITLLEQYKRRTHAYWLFTMLVERRGRFVKHMKDKGIPVSVVHQRIDKYSVFDGPYKLSGQAIFDKQHICLPVHDELSMDDIDSVVQAIEAGW